MPQERAHADEECNAHNERRHQGTQVAEHESASFRFAAHSFLSARDSRLPLSGQRPRRVVLHPKPKPDQLAFWLIAAPPDRRIHRSRRLRHPGTGLVSCQVEAIFRLDSQVRSGGRLPCCRNPSGLSGSACRSTPLPGSASCAPRRYPQSTATAIGCGKSATTSLRADAPSRSLARRGPDAV